MRSLVLLFVSIAITGSVVFLVLSRNAAFEGKEQGASVSGLPAGQAGLPKTTPLSEVEEISEVDESMGSDPVALGSDPKTLTDSIQTADKYLNDSLPLIEPKDRFVLIEKINGFKDNYEFAINPSGSDPAGLEIMIRATARYIGTWIPFYYYIHPDASRILGPVIKMLERDRAAMLGELAKRDAAKAGALATEDLEYYIEDIRKSAARRNSDFITFSLQDYERYRETFDELAQSHREFLFGFAEQAHILFDDFYKMHEEVDQEYLDKTRKKVEDVRLELRDLHEQALLGLEAVDAAAARAALGKTVLTIANELASHSDWREEIHDIMKSDYEFYKAIKL